MAADTPLSTAETRPSEGLSSANPPGKHALRLALGPIGIAVVIVSSVIFLYPVIAGPITGDDRYWYLWMGSSTDWSLLREVQTTWNDLTVRQDYGRLNVLTGFERRVAAKAVVETALATATPIVVYVALLKAMLLAGGVLSVLAMVRSLRWRDAEGRLVRVGRRNLLLIGLAGTLAVAVIAQAHSPNASGWNGWTAYPISTYGAVVSILGSVALVLWLTRLVAERTWRMALVAVPVLALLGAATNFRYELVFPAIPIVAVALVIVPVTDGAHRSAGRKAKLVTGLAYFGSFVPVFAGIRLYLADVCARTQCYNGIQVDLGLPAVRTTVFNVLSGVPGFGGNELLRTMEVIGMANRFPVLPNTWSVLAGVMATAGLLVVWWATSRREGALASAVPVAATSGSEPPTDGQQATSGGRDAGASARRAEAIALGIGAGLSLLAALGTAAVMGLSPLSHDIIGEPGTLYRNAMVTSTGLAFTVVISAVALGVLLSRSWWRALAVWAALAVGIGIVGACTLPANMMALRANRIIYTVSEAINWEVVQSETGPGSEARRCDLFERAVGTMGSGSLYRLYLHANNAFERRSGEPFCSDPKYRRST
ncbi:hypothetical protein ABN034_32840 [Actinopolymorpha sp. B11F2]|uniref:hypothetical protein n=1 Tax=Actinopolymorpha sp. B11F2 TaxID=3160862 RepID=UPI0032E392EC